MTIADILTNSTRLAVTETEETLELAVATFISTEERCVDVLGRFYTEIPLTGGRRIRITDAHYRNNWYIISEHDKAS